MKAFIGIILFFGITTFSLAGINVDQISGESVNTDREETIEISKMTKPLVLIFISKDCPCSKGNLSYINKLSGEYPDFKFLGVHSKKGSSTKDIKNYLSDKKINFEILNDSNLSITNKFDALKTPHVFIVNLKGEIIYNGGVTNSTFPENAKDFYLKNALEDLKNHRPIAKNETKTLGCFIVR